MKHPLRKISLGLWFAPTTICIVLFLWSGFDFENLGAEVMFHNGLNPWLWDSSNMVLLGISGFLSISLLFYTWRVKPNKAGDLTLLIFIIASYLIGGIRFIANFTV